MEHVTTADYSLPSCGMWQSPQAQPPLAPLDLGARDQLAGCTDDERLLTPIPIFDQLHSAVFGRNPNFRFQIPEGTVSTTPPAKSLPAPQRNLPILGLQKPFLKAQGRQVNWLT